MKSPEEFIERLKRSLQTPSTKDEKIKVVLICLAVSTTFWFFSALNKDDYITQINYPVELIFDPGGFIAVGEVPDRIPLEVTGGGWDLMTRSFGLNMKPIEINLQKPNEVSYILTSSLRGDLAPNLDPVAINYILTDTLGFNIQKRLSRKVKVRLREETIPLASNYVLDSEIDISPKSISIVGPEEMILSLPDTLYLELSETNIDEDFDQILDIPDFDELISVNVDQIKVNFQVDNIVSIDYNYPIQLINAPDSTWQILPSHTPVEIRIRSSLFDATDTIMFYLEADYDKMNMDSLISVDAVDVKRQISEFSIDFDTVKASKNE